MAAAHGTGWFNLDARFQLRADVRWKEMGWSAIIYLAAISGIDQEMYEAAEIDGASRIRQIFSITLPSIKGTIIIMFILAVGGLLNSNFDQIFVLWNPLNSERSNVIDIYTYTTAMRSMRYSYAAAIGLFKHSAPLGKNPVKSYPGQI